MKIALEFIIFSLLKLRKLIKESFWNPFTQSALLDLKGFREALKEHSNGTLDFPDTGFSSHSSVLDIWEFKGHLGTLALKVPGYMGTQALGIPALKGNLGTQAVRHLGTCGTLFRRLR